MNPLRYRYFYRRHLPHIQPPGATLFVTFRLAGSLTPEILQRLGKASDKALSSLRHISDPDERKIRTYLEQRKLFGSWDTELDNAQNGPMWLRDTRIAALVAESLHYRDARVYDLDAYCIMPNHVHMVYTPLQKSNGHYYALSEIMHSLKLYTGRQANQLLGRNGDFWQHESYDHVVRDEAENQRIIDYVLRNPVKARLVREWKEWPWSYWKYA